MVQTNGEFGLEADLRWRSNGSLEHQPASDDILGPFLPFSLVCMRRCGFADTTDVDQGQLRAGNLFWLELNGQDQL